MWELMRTLPTAFLQMVTWVPVPRSRLTASAKASRLWNSQSPLVSFWLQKICLGACCSANWISVHQLFLTISCVNINYYICSKTLCRVTKTSLFCIYTGQQNSWFIQDFKIFLTIILTHLPFDSLAFFRTRSAKWLCKLL